MTTEAMNWSRTMLQIDSRIQEAALILNETSLKIVLVTDGSGTLIGTISDGDIRRGLLKGLELSSPIKSIVNREALAVPPDLSREVVIQLMKANRIQQIPIVDDNLRVVGLHLWDQVANPVDRSNLMVIMAGGKGSRLHPKTENCPKPMLAITGKPILEHIIERAKIAGFSNFILAIHHLGYMIEEHFGDGHSLGVKIDYLHEESPLGTAGALSLLNPRPESAFIVTNGDVITDIPYGDLLDFHIQHEATATMSVRVHEWQNQFGVVQTQGIEIVGYEEKPLIRSHINAGVYVVDPSALEFLTKSAPCDMPILFEMLRHEKKKVIAYPVHEGWIDVGRPDELQRASDLESSRIERTKK